MDEEELVFKRFPAEKQDQVRGLVNYATLMGLTGKDLVSIGGKLDRIKVSRERVRNRELVQTVKIEPIHKDSASRMLERFKIKTAHGSYNFESQYNSWKITSLKTKVSKTHTPDWHDFGVRASWQKRTQQSMLLDIATGTFQLNF